MYRGFIKNITDLAGRSLGSADLRITNMTIKRDILSKASSDFTVLNVPSAAEVGNIFGVYDDYGKTVYLGVITGISDKEIQTDQIVSIFDDNWLWRDPRKTTIEATVKDILTQYFQGNGDALMSAIWSQYTITTSSSTSGYFPTQEKNYVINMMDFIFNLYENYEILFDINIPYSTGTPTINITKNTSTALTLGNNTYALRNFIIDRETQEKNKLVIYNEEGTSHRKTYYATTSGITDDSTSLNRLPKINTVYRFSADPLADILASNLSTQMYNHKITCELVLNNKLYDFDDFTLGRTCDIYYNGDYYNSVLTGYDISIDDEGEADKVKLIFGKVRYSLEKKLFVQSNKDNIQTSNHALQATNATNAETAVHSTYGNLPYGVCGTAASTVAKEVTVNDSAFELVAGAQVAVKFTYANSASAPTLNVNGTGAKGIMRHGTTTAGGAQDISWKIGSVEVLIYDGSNWFIANWWRDRPDNMWLEGQTVHKSHYVTQSASPNTAATGYTSIATFTITGAYFNTPIHLTVSSRRLPYVDLSITFATSSTTDPALSDFYASAYQQRFLLWKSATSTWKLLVAHAYTTEVFSILDMSNSPNGYANHTFAQDNTYYATLPGTIDTDVFEAGSLSNLHGIWSTVPSGTDLNTLTKPGYYYVSGGTTALNFPVGVNGSLIVFTGSSENIVHQIFFRQGTFGTNDYGWFKRGINLNSGIYGPWYRIYGVVEQGTSGNWTYKKYNDGKAECYKTLNTASCAITTQYSGGFYRTASTLGAEDFPSGLFTAVPAVFTGVTNTNGTIIYCTGPQTITKDTMGGNVNIHVGSGTYNCTNSYHAIGRWV